MNQAKFSQTQLANIMTAAGLLVVVLAQFGIIIPEETVAFGIGALWSIGWTIYNWIQRYKKGDLSLGGSRKHVQGLCNCCEREDTQTDPVSADRNTPHSS